MPVYEYHCDACGRDFSRFFKSQAAALGPVGCEHCGADGARRTISTFSMHYSLSSQIDRIDPQHERELEWADRHHKATDPLNRINMNFEPPA